VPELPEVEIFTRNLARWAGGQTLSRLEVVDPRIWGAPCRPEELEGREVIGAYRRAKYTVLDLGSWALVLHYRMTGKPVLDDGDVRRKVRLRLWFSEGTRVLFDDARCLGQAWILQCANVDSFLDARGLGPDAWPGRRDGAWWAARFNGVRAPIKAALLDQKRVAGVGNIGASEACYRAALDPRRPASSLTLAEWTAVAEGVLGWVDDTLAHELGDEIHFVTAGGEGCFRVYGRAGEPCPRCARVVERFVQRGRSTFWCPRCQGSR